MAFWRLIAAVACVINAPVAGQEGGKTFTDSPLEQHACKLLISEKRDGLYAPLMLAPLIS